jgi:hypothetical protein
MSWLGILEGEITFTVGGEQNVAAAGRFANMGQAE